MSRRNAPTAARRQAHLRRWAEATAVLEARAPERAAPEQAAYGATVAARAEHARRTGHAPRGRPPPAATPGPRDADQYNVTAPESRMRSRKTPSAQGFAPDDTVQVAVDQAGLLIGGHARSPHPNDTPAAAPPLAAIPPAIGTPAAAALDTGYFFRPGAPGGVCPACRGREPSIATGREPQHQSGQERCAPLPALVLRLRPLRPVPRDSTEGLQTQDGVGPSHLWGAYRHGRAGPRDRQRGPGLAAILAAWTPGHRGGGVPGRPGLHSQAAADAAPGQRW